MKRLINFICVFTLSLLITSTVQAATFYPKSISFTSPASSYNGGASEPVQIYLKDADTGIAREDMVYDIGVARELPSGKIVEYEILNTESVRYTTLEKDNFQYSVKIPNLNKKTNDTYVIFIKSYRANDPDSESFLVSESFTITPTDKKTITLDKAFILTSAGEAFGLAVGPTLYAKPQNKLQATSSELILQFTSNTKVDVKGTVSFKKIRTNDFSKTEEVEIKVFEGQDSYGIDLPTFDYEPGVYMGELKLSAEGVQLPEKIDFQYIIDGPIVSVGQLRFIGATSTVSEFLLPVFGRPVDIYTSSSTSDSGKEVYKTVLTFLDKDDMILAEHATELDYKKGIRQILVSDIDWKKISKVTIKTFDDNDMLIFTTTQNVTIPLPERNSVHLIYAGIIILLGISWYLVTRRKGVIVLTVIMGAIFIYAYTFASWSPTTADGQSLNVNVSTEKYSKAYFTFNADFTTESVSCTEGTDVFLKMIFAECQNRVRETANFGVSKISMADARANYTGASYSIASSTCQGQDKIFRWRGKEYVFPCGSTGHDPFLYTTSFIKIASLKGPIAPDTKLYISVKGSKGLHAEYAMPLAPSSCDRCSNVTGEQLTKNFSAYGRDYFYVDSDSKLYFAPASATGASVCAVDMCADTEAREEVIPEGKVWNISATSGYDKYSCIDRSSKTCTCSGRTQVCTENGVETQVANASQCALQASCTFVKTGNQATFTFSPIRGLGNITYSGQNLVTRTIPTNGSITESMSLTDSFDGLTASASCTAGFNDLDTGPNTGLDSTADCDPAVTTCPNNNGGGTDTSLPPTIGKFTASKYVEQGQSCIFTWEVQNAATCTLGGQSINPISGTKSFPTTDGKNVTKTLSCTNGGDAPQTVNSTATCYVQPTIIQN